MHPVARQALLAALADGWADPGKLYAQARRARQLLDAARAATAEILRVRPDELSFTPSGTAAAHAAVLGGLAARRRTGSTLVHSAIEHSAVLHAAEQHAKANPTANSAKASSPTANSATANGSTDGSQAASAVADGGATDGGATSNGPAGGGRPDVVSVPVDRLGRVELDAWAAAVARPGVALAALISASHEAGTVQPVAEAAGACAAAGVPLYVDAAQSVPWGAPPDGWSLLTASAHKWGGPPGVGLLVVRKGTRWESPYPADERESGRTPGVLNLPAIVAAAAALRAVTADAAAQVARLGALTDRIRAVVPATVPDVEVVGDPERRLPHLVTFSCLYVDGEALLHALDRRGFAVSSGSSCTSSTLRPSHVLEAMGVLSHGNIRVSLHRDTTAEEVDRFLAELPGIVADLRAEAGVVGL
ncbi:aminotransferase class V-fold PLP-dependent enzyme [Solwaraspora sp. WMMD1047]|uniref:cysteine desulfurase family protein n=1 Tax=Solwaraspora sp. WMMD1047 TaxID=3016102 RepID=UPI0024178303|nr:aminotransferase class V-fold PLP-dependent enzyme [Solwaraspora sp. WMMD1047]MDG4832264.1 aminotransferase class V-fold PLP-dependent enzyme [Solwaraspora sp. WMMD1047]